MIDALQDLVSFRWWLSVVAVGLFINLFTAYVKPVIDNWLARYSKKRRDSIATKAEEYRRLVERLRAEPTLIATFRHHEIICRFRFLGFLLMGAVLLLCGLSLRLSEPTAKLFGLGIMMLSLFYMMLAMIEMRGSHKKGLAVNAAMTEGKDT